MLRCVWRGLVPALVLLGACTDDPPRGGAVAAPGVVVASFDFDESDLLAEIYAQALADEGVAVRRELHLGPRELVLPALRAGLVDVVPEYAGSALDAATSGRVDPPPEPEALALALRAALRPSGVDVLAPSRASNQNVFAVTASLASTAGLRAVSDLGSLPAPPVLGGPPECRQRPRCLPGLRDRYGLDVAGFVPLAGAALVERALTDGVVDVGVLFSTDAALASDGLVALRDDQQLQPPDNVVPVVRAAVLDDRRIRRTLDEVSAELTTEGLRFVNWRLAHTDTSVEVEARGWLLRHGLVDR